MAFTKKMGEDFYIDKNTKQIKLAPTYLNKMKPKKITGSRFATILNLSKYTSPVRMWATMVGIFKDEIDPIYAKVGNAIEPKIHQVVCDKLNINYKQYNPFTVKFDIFQENPIFGGIPDGEPVDSDGKLLYPSKPMLEIKTTSIDAFSFKKEGTNFVLQKDLNNRPIIKTPNKKRDSWFDTDQNIVIPNDYKFQLGLYCYLRNVEIGLFAICFLQTDDYVRPEEVDVNDREIQLVDFKVDLKKFKSYIDYATDWYNTYILKGESPQFSNDDIIWLQDELGI